MAVMTGLDVGDGLDDPDEDRPRRDVDFSISPT
jgi:hypothetical protein